MARSCQISSPVFNCHHRSEQGTGLTAHRANNTREPPTSRKSSHCSKPNGRAWSSGDSAGWEAGEARSSWESVGRPDERFAGRGDVSGSDRDIDITRAFGPALLHADDPPKHDAHTRGSAVPVTARAVPMRPKAKTGR